MESENTNFAYIIPDLSSFPLPNRAQMLPRFPSPHLFQGQKRNFGPILTADSLLAVLMPPRLFQELWLSTTNIPRPGSNSYRMRLFSPISPETLLYCTMLFRDAAQDAGANLEDANDEVAPFQMDVVDLPADRAFWSG
jgi:hypothetical protein